MVLGYKEQLYCLFPQILYVSGKINTILSKRIPSIGVFLDCGEERCLTHHSWIFHKYSGHHLVTKDHSRWFTSFLLSLKHSVSRLYPVGGTGHTGMFYHRVKEIRPKKKKIHVLMCSDSKLSIKYPRNNPYPKANISILSPMCTFSNKHVYALEQNRWPSVKQALVISVSNTTMCYYTTSISSSFSLH